MIRDIPILVSASGMVASTPHSPSPSGNQRDGYTWHWLLNVDIALDERSTPLHAQVLRNEHFAHVVVPHKARVNAAPGAVAPHLKMLLLETAGDVHAECVEEAFSQILLYLVQLLFALLHCFHFA